MSRFLAFLGWAVVAAVPAFLPWFGPLFDFKLISDYFQPRLNSVASVVAVIAFVTTYVLSHKGAQWKKKRVMIWGFIGAAVAFAICLIFTHTVGVVWAPGVAMTVIIRISWIMLYVLLFLSLSIGLCAMCELIPQKEIETTPAPPTPNQGSVPDGK